jgi:hypothetical protein
MLFLQQTTSFIGSILNKYSEISLHFLAFFYHIIGACEEDSQSIVLVWHSFLPVSHGLLRCSKKKRGDENMMVSVRLNVEVAFLLFSVQDNGCK